MRRYFAALTILLLPILANSQEIEPVHVNGNVYMLKGAGGNIGLAIGEDGNFLVDDQYGKMSEKIAAAVKALDDRPIKFVINTHFHPDHTGSNEFLANAGSIVIAHQSVRTRLSVEQFVPYFNNRHDALPEAGLPVVTFTRDLTFHMNDDDIEVLFVGPAHTDGDAIVVFHSANVIHTGDIYFSHGYPFADLSNGGSMKGVIKAVERILTFCNDSTKLIPGHGTITDAAELKAWHEMLVTVYNRVKAAFDDGKSLEEIVAAKPTVEFDGAHKGAIPGKDFVEFIYTELGK
jgi:glyoxylase-like metal-dependent hydrolase (beta-lactamase superfamily II)